MKVVKNYADIARENLRLYSPEKISVSDLLAVIIGDLNPETALNLSLHNIRNLFEMSEADIQDLGVSAEGAQKIIASFELAKRFIASKKDTLRFISGPETAASFLMEVLKEEKQECFVCMFLNTKNELMTYKTIFKGSLDACLIHPREIFNEAVKCRASKIIAAHNHPSGNTKPSQNDIDLTKRLIDAGNIMGIELLDHLIIGEGYYSFRAEGSVNFCES